MEEKEKRGVVEESEGTNKRDFLKVLGAGLGIAGLGSMMGGPPLHKRTRRENT